MLSFNLNLNNNFVKISIAPHRIILSLCTATITSLSLLATTNSAQAVTVQFNDLASFTAATTTQNIDFEGTAGAGGVTFYPSGLAINGVTFTALSGFGTPFDVFAVDPAILPGENFGSGTNIRSCSGCEIVATLSSGITAVGGDFAGLVDISVPFTITLSTGETFNLNSPNSFSFNFAGFTSDTAISSISFKGLGDSNSYYGGTTRLDNFRFGTANAAASVPEPFTVIGTLVGGTTALRMRKKLKSAQK
jgi:hypothetical protein